MKVEKYEKAPITVLGLKLAEEVGELNKEIVHLWFAGELRLNIWEEIKHVETILRFIKDRAEEEEGK